VTSHTAHAYCVAHRQHSACWQLLGGSPGALPESLPACCEQKPTGCCEGMHSGAHTDKSYQGYTLNPVLKAQQVPPG
jgi:hypothetical protein